MVHAKHENMVNHKYSEIWGKIKALVGKDFDVEVVNNNIYIKKSSNTGIKTDFYDEEGLPPEQTPCFNYLLILVDSANKKDKTYYPKALLKECKYLVKDKETKNIYN